MKLIVQLPENRRDELDALAEAEDLPVEEVVAALALIGLRLSAVKGGKQQLRQILNS